jgi:hypothetical protein
MRSRRVLFNGLLLCCSLMAFSATAQTVPNTPGTAKTTGTPPIGQKPHSTNPPPPSCLRTSPFATKDMDFVVKKVFAAGYTNVRGLYKGCDALWRGHALQNGIDTAIMVTPTGQVLRNGYGALAAPVLVPSPSQ